MKIVCISDTHLQQDFDIPDGDVLLHAGDATFHGYRHEIDVFSDWYGNQPHTHKVFVAGNHDCVFEDSPSQGRSWLHTQIIYLEDSFVELTVGNETVKIYGAPWQPYFGGWSFNLRTDSELKSKWDKIPKDTDVLITHGPPYKLCDMTTRNVHAGCRELRKAIQRTRPLLHVCGHIHEGYGVSRFGDTLIANASVCNHRYRPVHEPLVFELENGKITQIV